LCVVAAFDGARAVEALRVLEPNGGEQYTVGDTMPLRWEDVNPQNYPIVQVNVVISFDGGERWCQIFNSAISPGSPGYGDTSWVITPEVVRPPDDTVSTVSELCIVRVYDYINNTYEDYSDSAFTIVDAEPPPPTGNNGGEGDDEDDGCGTGTGAVLFPLVVLRAARRLRRRQAG